MQRSAAGDERLDPLTIAERRRDIRRRIGHMLEVVKYEQHLLVGKALLYLFDTRLSRLLAHIQRLSDGRENEGGIAHRNKRDEHNAIGTYALEIIYHLLCKARFANACRADQREQTHIRLFKQADDFLSFLLPTNQGGQWAMNRCG